MPRSPAAVLAATTPDSRDRTIDFLRVTSLAAVVVGHWLMAAVEWRDGGFEGHNLLAVQPGTRLLTWLFQVMPLFFVVGGVANSASWAGARRSGRGYGTWLRGRAERLLRPTAVFVACWCVATVVLPVAGVDRDHLVLAGRVVAFPLWFLAVYLGVVAAVPALVVLVGRMGLRLPVVLGVGVAMADWARWSAGLEVVGLVNFALVWLFATALGVAWRSGLLPTTRSGAWALVTGGLVGLVVLTTVGGYPVSLVGAEQARDNNSPPSLVLVALAVAQIGVVLVARERLARWLARPRVWVAVVTANGMAMTVFLWHLMAVVAAAVVLLPSGLFPSPAIGSILWWAWRPVWIVALTVAVVPLVVAFARFERSSGAAQVCTTGRALAGVATAAVAMCTLTLRGLVSLDAPLGLPWPALALFAVSAWLLGAFVPGRGRRQLQEPVTVPG